MASITVQDCHALTFADNNFDIVVDAERLEHDTDFSRRTAKSSAC